MLSFRERTTFTHCRCCGTPMIGIHDPAARDMCEGCGGEAIIGNQEDHRSAVMRALARLRRAGQIRRDCTPRGTEAA